MNRAGTIAFVIVTFVAAAGCNVICDSDELKSPYSDSDLDCEGGRLDPKQDLCWQDPRAGKSFEWQEAIDYCDGLDLAGHADWYLPSRDEFIDLLGGCEGDHGPCDSCDQSGTCSALFGSDSDRYWSSSVYADSSSSAWYVGFGYGYVGYYAKKHAGLRVRCVRRGP
jgi:hypothetical protein